MRRRNLTEATEAKKCNNPNGRGKLEEKPRKEATEETSEAKEVRITSREATFRTAEK